MCTAPTDSDSPYRRTQVRFTMRIIASSAEDIFYNLLMYFSKFLFRPVAPFFYFLFFNGIINLQMQAWFEHIVYQIIAQHSTAQHSRVRGYVVLCLDHITSLQGSEVRGSNPSIFEFNFPPLNLFNSLISLMYLFLYLLLQIAFSTVSNNHF